MFSLTPKDNVAPLVPVPAPAKISPVAFSSINTSIIFELNSFPSETLPLTDLKKFKDFILLIDFVYSISLKGSPSSISIWFLITDSLVTLFPKIFIFTFG